MARNTQLEPPPLWSPFQEPNTNHISKVWEQWFTKLQYFLSVDNHQVITAATEVKLDAEYVQVNTTSATYAITLDPPTVPKKRKTIQMKTRTGAFNVTLALTNVVGGTAATTCTFNTAGGCLILESLYDKWIVLKEFNVTLT